MTQRHRHHNRQGDAQCQEDDYRRMVKDSNPPAGGEEGSTRGMTGTDATKNSSESEKVMDRNTPAGEERGSKMDKSGTGTTKKTNESEKLMDSRLSACEKEEVDENKTDTEARNKTREEETLEGLKKDDLCAEEDTVMAPSKVSMQKGKREVSIETANQASNPCKATIKGNVMLKIPIESVKRVDRAVEILGDIKTPLSDEYQQQIKAIMDKPKNFQCCYKFTVEAVDVQRLKTMVMLSNHLIDCFERVVDEEAVPHAKMWLPYLYEKLTVDAYDYATAARNMLKKYKSFNDVTLHCLPAHVNGNH